MATIVGTLIGFFVKELPHKWNDAVLGFCAGVMLAAATLGLIVPAVQEAGLSHWWLPAIGVAVGALFLNVLDLLTPHMHMITGLDMEEHRNNGSSVNKVLLFVMAVAIHKLPEGIATGVGFNAEELSGAWGVTFGIALQNIPEGMVVVTPLLLVGVKKMRAFLISLAIALMEVVGVWIGYGIGAISAYLLPVMLAFAGGAMLYVVVEELIPEMSTGEHSNIGVVFFAVGFSLMMALDVALG